MFLSKVRKFNELLIDCHAFVRIIERSGRVGEREREEGEEKEEEETREMKGRENSREMCEEIMYR